MEKMLAEKFWLKNSRWPGLTGLAGWAGWLNWNMRVEKKYTHSAKSCVIEKTLKIWILFFFFKIVRIYAIWTRPYKNFNQYLNLRTCWYPKPAHHEHEAHPRPLPSAERKKSPLSLILARIQNPHISERNRPKVSRKTLHKALGSSLSTVYQALQGEN